MISRAILAKLKDPVYFERHLAAALAFRATPASSRYDSRFQRTYEAARKYLQSVAHHALDAFEAGFAPLHPPADFAPQAANNLFTPQQLARIRHISATLPDSLVERHELEHFGRTVVHDHPYFVELQSGLIPLVSKLAGQPLEPGYNFLSLYGASGTCDVHLDQPVSMFTLDFCIDQSGDWPIHFSRLIDWTSLDQTQQWQSERIRTDASLEFRPYSLQPGNGLLFCGSSQWHYRDPILAGGFCNLLFFHYFPAGCGDLVDPSGWSEHFALPELAPFCDLYDELYGVAAKQPGEVD